MRSKYGRTVGSRSMATSFPLSCRSDARTREWPPAPKVASTTVSPGCTSRSSRTSSRRTGTRSSASVRGTFGNISDAPFDRADVSRPLRATPDLDVVVDADHGDLLAEARVASEVRRNEHAPLLVYLRDGRSCEDEALHLARLPRERVERGDPRDACLTVRPRIDVDRPTDAPSGD